MNRPHQHNFWHFPHPAQRRATRGTIRVVRPWRTRGLTALLCGALALAGWPPAAHATDGLLLLTNGNLLAGNVVREGDFYKLTRPGSELMIPASQVDSFCRSSAEAYEVRRRRTYDDAAGHVQLARWCLQHALWQHAAGEVLVARAQDPQSPGLQFVERQLAAELRRQAESHAATHSAAGDPASRPPGGVSSADAPNAGATDVETARPAIVPSLAARAQFVRSIQPMLVHSCATTGCHQPGTSTPMPLDRMAMTGGGSPAAVERNLQAVMPLLDVKAPDDCQLVQWARRNHAPAGGANTAISAHQAELLVQWVRDAVGYVPPPPPSESPANPPDDFGEAARNSEEEFLSADEMLLSDAELKEYGVSAPSALAAEALPARDEMIAVGEVRSEPAPPPGPRDPFDPAEFNRRIAKRRADMQASQAKATDSTSADEGATGSNPAPTQ
ncbi:MAG: hypothetical protein KDA44_17795 [Planctomycetales bacterium]|nr:hypothetical protein [Planctomycetales bacterium]